MLKVQKLCKKINDKLILNNLTFEVDHSEIGIFLGGSGVGKSTLLRILNNLESYDSGFFSLDDTSLNLAHVNKEHTMGLVFQHFNLFENLSVENNITLALVKLKRINQEQARQIATQFLKRYDLIAFAHYPVNKLSGGQKQRLAIARTLAVNPKIICMDEPTSALDPRLTRQVATYIQDLATDGRIVLLATHDTDLIHQLSNGKLFLMKEGAIIESCTVQRYKDTPHDYPALNLFLKPPQHKVYEEPK